MFIPSIKWGKPESCMFTAPFDLKYKSSIWWSQTSTLLFPKNNSKLALFFSATYFPPWLPRTMPGPLLGYLLKTRPLGTPNRHRSNSSLPVKSNKNISFLFSDGIIPGSTTTAPNANIYSTVQYASRGSTVGNTGLDCVDGADCIGLRLRQYLPSDLGGPTPFYDITGLCLECDFTIRRYFRS